MSSFSLHDLAFPIRAERLDDVIRALADSPVSLLVLLPLGSIGLWYATSWITSPLRKYPGPFLASCTNYWRMYHAAGGSMHLVTKEMHEKYGPVVRMAPNYLDLDYASLIKTCFDTHGVWRKTEWHGVSGVKAGNQVIYNIFSECDPASHARIKKPIAKYFSVSGVASFECHVDNAIALFAKQLDERFAAKDGAKAEGFNFGEWAMFFSWDAVAMTTWSQPVGYLEKGFDFDGTLYASEKAAEYLVTIGMQPWLDNLFDKNPVYRIGPPTFGALTNIGLGHLIRRYKGEDGHDPAKPDFMDRYIDAKAEHPEVVDDTRILTYLLVNLAAGADTTAVSLKSIFYLSLKHPHVWARLQRDILAAGFTSFPAPYAQTRHIPYLEAVVREALRYLPGNCFPQERYVPRGGLTLPDGTVVPEGTAVGFNAYVLHRNQAVWGADAAEFKPERWLRDEDAGETEEAFRDRMRAMNAADLSFGAGTRMCIGKNLGMMEVYKTVATLVSLFEWELAEPEKEWKIHCALFPKQSGIVLRMRRREGAGALLEGMKGDF